MSSSVSTSDGFAWLELDDFCPKLSVPCFDDIQEILCGLCLPGFQFFWTCVFLFFAIDI